MSRDIFFETVGARVFVSAQRHESQIALSCQGKAITYGLLNQKSLQIAALLHSRGIQKQNIGILTQRTISAYTGILGTLYAGCSYVPLNPKHPISRLASMIKVARISTLIFDESENIDLPELLKLAGGVNWVLLPEKDIENVMPLPEPILSGANDLAYIMFTSGSTGIPKGVLVTHANVVSHIDNMTEMYEFAPGDRCSQTFDLSFDPSVSDIFCAWFNGSTLCVLPAEEMYCVSEFIQREKITFWASVPTLANFMIKLGQLNPCAFPSLKHSTFCGEPFPQSVANLWSEAAPNSTIENIYGPTEATVYVTRHVYQKQEQARNYSNKIVPIGLPLPGQRAVLVDENLLAVPAGKIGELCVSGSQVTLGYLDDPEKTAQVFVAMPWDNGVQNRWYKTGDLALFNEDGNLECLGRIDSQIKIGGQRMELGEIEAMLREIVETNDVAVIPTSYVDGMPQGVVAFIAKELSPQNIVEIQGRCKQKLLSPFVPKSIHTLKALPLNTSGKIDRKALKVLLESTTC